MGLFERFKKSTAPVPAGQVDVELQVLIGQLGAPDWKLRNEAAVKLGEFGARALPAVPALEEAVSDDNNDVCLSAADALSAIRRATQ
jgi:HEAT repeat protein